MTTRNGKIARLPHAIRAELNRRLQDGEPGKHLVLWLNQSEKVRNILHRVFGGRPISEQNLSEWKAGGYLDWLRQEESRQLVASLAEEQAQLTGAGGLEISDRFASLLAVELVKLGRELLAQQTAAPERWQCLCQILGQLSQVRRDDHRALQTRINHQRWHRQVEAEDAASAECARKKKRDKKLAFYYAAFQVDFRSGGFGGGPDGRSVAAHVLELERDLAPGALDQVVDKLNSEIKAETQKPDNLVPAGRPSASHAGLPRRSPSAKAGASARRAVASERSPERRPKRRLASRPNLPRQSEAAASPSGSEFRLQAASAKPPGAQSPEPQSPLKSHPIKPNQTESNQKLCAVGDGLSPPEVPARRDELRESPIHCPKTPNPNSQTPDPVTPSNTR